MMMTQHCMKVWRLKRVTGEFLAGSSRPETTFRAGGRIALCLFISLVYFMYQHIYVLTCKLYISTYK